MDIITYFFFTTLAFLVLFALWAYSRSLFQESNNPSTSLPYSGSYLLFSYIITCITGIFLIPEHLRTNKNAKEISSMIFSLCALALFLLIMIAISKYILVGNPFLPLLIKFASTGLLTALIPLAPTPAYTLIARLFPKTKTVYSYTQYLLPLLLVLGSIAELLGIPLLGYTILHLADLLITLLHFSL